jgi:hypothetical protein
MRGFIGPCQGISGMARRPWRDANRALAVGFANKAEATGIRRPRRHRDGAQAPFEIRQSGQTLRRSRPARRPGLARSPRRLEARNSRMCATAQRRSIISRNACADRRGYGGSASSLDVYQLALVAKSGFIPLSKKGRT